MGERRRLVLLVERDPDPACDACKGNGVFVEEVTEHECFCCTSSYLPPSPEDIAAHVTALPHAKAVEVLRALLRAAPDAAVEAVDTSKVARAWSPSERQTNPMDMERKPLGPFGRPWVCGGGLKNSDGNSWFAITNTCIEVESAEKSYEVADRMAEADGWVFAGGPRG